MDSMGGILTKGLGAPACCGLIIARFNLAKCCQFSITATPQYDGGSKPLAPGEVANFYTPVTPGGKSTNKLSKLDYLVPYNPPQPVEKITISLTINGKQPITKQYFVPKYRSKIIVNISRFIVGVSGVINVSVIGLRNKLAEQIRVFVEKLRKR